MREINIQTPVKIGTKVLIQQNLFENLAENPIINCKCVNCKYDNKLLINPDKGKLLDNLFLDRIIPKHDLILNGVAKETSKLYRYLGELFIFQNLPALYNFVECSNCGVIYLIVFSTGESQPGRNIHYIGGIWFVDNV